MTTTAEKRKALGRGLESLLPGGPRVVTPIATTRPDEEKNRAASGNSANGSTGGDNHASPGVEASASIVAG
jgi:hypothetical protein